MALMPIRVNTILPSHWGFSAMNWSMAINFRGMPLRRSRRSMPRKNENKIRVKQQKRKKDATKNKHESANLDTRYTASNTLRNNMWMSKNLPATTIFPANRSFQARIPSSNTYLNEKTAEWGKYKRYSGRLSDDQLLHMACVEHVQISTQHQTVTQA